MSDDETPVISDERAALDLSEINLNPVEEVKVLARFARELEMMSERGRRAALRWCVARYLGGVL